MPYPCEKGPCMGGTPLSYIIGSNMQGLQGAWAGI